MQNPLLRISKRELKEPERLEVSDDPVIGISKRELKVNIGEFEPRVLGHHRISKRELKASSDSSYSLGSPEYLNLKKRIESPRHGRTRPERILRISKRELKAYRGALQPQGCSRRRISKRELKVSI